MNRSRLLGFCAIVIGLALAVFGLWLLLKPAEYKAVVRFEMQPEVPTDPRAVAAYSQYFLETELPQIVSKAVLTNVIGELRLDAEWGRRYGAGKTPGMDEAFDLLRQRMSINASEGTMTVEISVTDDNPGEAARIANAIAAEYGEYRSECFSNEMELRDKKAEAGYEEETTNITEMEAHFAQLRQKIGPANAALLDEYFSTNGPAHADDEQRSLAGELYQQREAVQANPTDSVQNLKLERLLEQWCDARNELSNNQSNGAALAVRYADYYQTWMSLQWAKDKHEISKEEIEARKRPGGGKPLVYNITIIDPAVAPTSRVGPSRWLRVASLVCGLIMLGTGLYSLRSGASMQILIL